MKIRLYQSLAVVMVLLITLIGCGGGDPSPSAPTTTALLTASGWKLKTVTVDGVNKNSDYTNFAINFSATGFTSTNGAPVWPASGTWAFVDSTQKSIKRNDNVVVTIKEISEQQVVLSLTWITTSLGGGRTASVSGAYEFTLSH